MKNTKETKTTEKAVKTATAQETVAVDNQVKPKMKVAPKAKKEVATETVKATPKPKQTSVEAIPATSTKGTNRVAQAKIFPATIEHPELGNLVSCSGKFTSYADVKAALEAEKTIYLAAYWTKRHIKEFRYGEQERIKAPKNGFPLDLDIATPVMVSETVDRVIFTSVYTEILYLIYGDEFEYVEDKDPRDDTTYSVRISVGMEFEIYEPAEQAEAKAPKAGLDKAKAKAAKTTA